MASMKQEVTQIRAALTPIATITTASISMEATMSSARPRDQFPVRGWREGRVHAGEITRKHEELPGEFKKCRCNISNSFQKRRQ